MKIRAAVLEQTGGELAVQELDLAPPAHGEVLVRLHASGVCHSDFNAIDGTSETRCPAVLGHEGAGVVEAVGPGVQRVALGDHVALSWAPSCGECAECLRELPQLCSRAWPAMGTGGLMDGTPRLSRDGGSFVVVPAEATRARARGLAFDRALAANADRVRGHFDGALPATLVVQSAELSMPGRRALLVVESVLP